MLQITTETSKSHATGAIIGTIIAVILFIALIATIVAVVCKKRMDRDGPPTHKPPPPKKHTTISYNAVPTPVNHTDNSVPLTYYETQRAEPVTDLDSYHAEDDDDLPKPFDHSPSEVEGSEMLPPYYELREMDTGTDAYPSSLSREDSFMSAPMIV